MARVNAGSLIHSVTLLVNGQEVPNGQGGFTPGQPTTKQVHAAVEPARGQTAYRIGQELKQTVWAVRIRAYTGFVQPDRLTWRGRTLKVHSALPSLEQRPEYIDLFAYDSGQ